MGKNSLRTGTTTPSTSVDELLPAGVVMHCGFRNWMALQDPQSEHLEQSLMWAMVNTHYMVDGHPIHHKDPKIMVIINPYEPLDD